MTNPNRGSILSGMRCRWFFLLALAVGGVVFGQAPATVPAPAPSTRPVYDHREPSPGGTGIFYMGREVARYMSHLGADWLDRPEREREEGPSILVKALKLKDTDTVADIGCGTGYMSLKMAAVVTRGRVLAEDIQPEMLDRLEKAAAQRNVTNITPVLGTETDPKLPENAVDLALLVDAYHEFDHPWEMTQAILRGLKPGGRLVLVEYRGEDPSVPIKRLHKMTAAQVRKEMAAAGLIYMGTDESLPRQHIFFFYKPSPDAAAGSPTK